MSDAHDNSRPAVSGSYNISKSGIVYYFPIQEQLGLRPFLALVLLRRPDGEVYCAINERWGPLVGFDSSVP